MSAEFDEFDVAMGTASLFPKNVGEIIKEADPNVIKGRSQRRRIAWLVEKFVQDEPTEHEESNLEAAEQLALQLSRRIRISEDLIIGPGYPHYTARVRQICLNYIFDQLQLNDTALDTTIIPSSALVINRQAIVIHPFQQLVEFNHQQDYVPETEMLFLYQLMDSKINNVGKLTSHQLAPIMGVSQKSVHSLAYRLKQRFPGVPILSDTHYGYSIDGEIDESDGNTIVTRFQPIEPQTISGVNYQLTADYLGKRIILNSEQHRATRNTIRGLLYLMHHKMPTDSEQVWVSRQEMKDELKTLISQVPSVEDIVHKLRKIPQFPLEYQIGKGYRLLD